MLSRILLSIAATAGLIAPVAAQDRGRDIPEPRVQFVVPQRPIVQPYHQAPVRISAAEANVRIRDRVATTDLVITVSNPGPQLAEAQLLLPVPDGSAIKSFKLDALGDDSQAVLLPAAEARRIYDEIVRKIVDPGLLEFAGMGLIRSSVFPVEGGKTQTFRVSYEQVLNAHAGRVDYVLPRTEALDTTGVEWSITLDIESSSGLGPIVSPSHPIETMRDGSRKARVRVNAPNDPGSFRLSVLHQSEGGGMTVIAYPDARVADGQGGYFMLVGGAPDSWATTDTPDREVTLVIDRSGSMRGDKIKQAKLAALQVLEGLNTGERFNIIDYSGTVERFAPQPRVKNAETMAAARAYINALEANGSTNLHDALVAALRQPTADGSLPLVLFLTDGRATDGVTSEVGIRDAAKAANEHHRRVFTFGVGFDVNAPLLTGLAEATRAAPTFVLPEDSIEVKVSEVFDRLDGPVLVNPIVDAYAGDMDCFPSHVRELQPRRLSDLYDGDQLIVLGRYTDNKPFTLRLRGTVSTDPNSESRSITMTFNPADASVANSYVPRMWAQRRIGEIIGQIRQAGAEGREPDTELVEEIVRLSTEHGILTEYTSFLAAEETQFAARPGESRDDAFDRVAAPVRSSMSRSAVGGRTGSGAVTQELNQQAQTRRGYAMKNEYQYADTDGRVQTREITTVQRVNQSTMFRRAGNRWVEAPALEREADEPDQTIDFATDAYFALVTDLATQNRQGLIANRGDVLLLNHGQLVLVRNPS
ncbi:MAG: inter-alpha-trypsin inhibitor domain-containing protein [Phycisphaeraceae bacterium]|nr:MAG: inter-alpha-trypsin inhibitor domain-containing protein [Phycisphaeraceae bacterium]